MTTDPLVCPRCGGPKTHDDILCPPCAAVTPTQDDDIGIDDPPARDYPQAFGDNYGAD